MFLLTEIRCKNSDEIQINQIKNEDGTQKFIKLEIRGKFGGKIFVKLSIVIYCEMSLAGSLCLNGI